MYRHALVTGATGMMAGVVEYLSSRSHLVTFTARSSESVSRLERKMEERVACRGIALDWNRKTQFVRELSAFCSQLPSPDLVVAWLHDDSLGSLIAAALANGKPSRSTR